MPAGDAQRVWFPEMVELLRSGWRDRMDFPAIIELRDMLDTMLPQIRSDRTVRTPIFTCPACGMTGPAAEPRITVRAMILSLARFGIAPGEQVKSLERAWPAYRKDKGLDL